MPILWVYEALAMELRALAILDRHLATEFHPQPSTYLYFYCFINRILSLKNNFIANIKIINPYEC